jgi:hypothetical protein
MTLTHTRRGAEVNVNRPAPRTSVLIALAAAAVLAAAVGAEAQAVGRPLGQYQLDIQRAVAGRHGMTPEQARAANALLDQVLTVVRADPTATASPPSMCMRLRTHAYVPGDDGRVAVEVDVSFPIVVQGQCYNMTTTALRVWVNDLAPLLTRMTTGGRSPDAGEEPIFAPLRPTHSPSTHPRYGRFVVIARAGETPFLPLPREDFLRSLERDWMAGAAELDAGSRALDEALGGARDRWFGGERARFVAEQEQGLADLAPYLSAQQLAEMRETMRQVLIAADEGVRRADSAYAAHAPGMRERGERTTDDHLQRVRDELAALSPAERRTPTCLDVNRVLFSAGPATCPVHEQPVMANAGYWRRGLPPGAAQLVLVEIGDLTGSRGSGPGADARFALQQEIVHRLAANLEYAALEALIR